MKVWKDQGQMAPFSGQFLLLLLGLAWQAKCDTDLRSILVRAVHIMAESLSTSIDHSRGFEGFCCSPTEPSLGDGCLNAFKGRPSALPP